MQYSSKERAFAYFTKNVGEDTRSHASIFIEHLATGKVDFRGSSQRKGSDSLDDVPLTVKQCIKQTGLLKQCTTHGCDTKISLVYYLSRSN